MRYDLMIKEEVRRLRRNGLSLSQIYEKTKVPITTIRSWISSIVLSKDQKNALRDRTQRALQGGRIKAQRLKKEKRAILEKTLLNKGIREIGKLSSREFFLIGVGLYWAEGFKNKHERRLGFCNSDPTMIKFYITWLEKALNIKRKDLIARLTLNIYHKNKTLELEKYWSRITSIPLSQFTKPFYQNSLWKKQYNVDTYRGVLRIHVKNSLDYLLKMRGWIKGLTLSE